jgi:putative flippase GtrA
MDRWLSLPKIIRFFIIGSINAAISYIIYAIAIFVLGEVYYQLAIALQWLLSSVTSYVNQKFFVFCTRGNYLKEYTKCCSTWVVSYFLNAVILEVFVRYLIKNVYIAQFVSLFIVSLVTYVLFKFFAFRTSEK